MRYIKEALSPRDFKHTFSNGDQVYLVDAGEVRGETWYRMALLVDGKEHTMGMRHPLEDIAKDWDDNIEGYEKKHVNKDANVKDIEKFLKKYCTSVRVTDGSSDLGIEFLCEVEDYKFSLIYSNISSDENLKLFRQLFTKYWDEFLDVLDGYVHLSRAFYSDISDSLRKFSKLPPRLAESNMVYGIVTDILRSQGVKVES